MEKDYLFFPFFKEKKEEYFLKFYFIISICIQPNSFQQIYLLDAWSIINDLVNCINKLSWLIFQFGFQNMVSHGGQRMHVLLKMYDTHDKLTITECFIRMEKK